MRYFPNPLTYCTFKYMYIHKLIFMVHISRTYFAKELHQIWCNCMLADWLSTSLHGVVQLDKNFSDCPSRQQSTSQLCFGSLLSLSAGYLYEKKTFRRGTGCVRLSIVLQKCGCVAWGPQQTCISAAQVLGRWADVDVSWAEEKELVCL